jgi:branched-chain amino acid transport system ATP-binding protein
VLSVEDLVVAYGGSTALWGVSLEVRANEVVTIVGPNGAGKTTLMHAIAGIIPVVQGRIMLAGADVTMVPPHKRPGLGIALSPEGRRLFGTMTVIENLRAGAHSCRSRVELHRRLDRVLTLFPRLAERRSQIARTMSGGEQQMVSIGRALMAAPRLLLLDEPSLGLAPIIQREVFRAVGEIRAAGLTVLLVEQNVQDSLSIADRGYVLENGHVRLEATACALLADPWMRRAYLGLDGIA